MNRIEIHIYYTSCLQDIIFPFFIVMLGCDSVDYQNMTHNFSGMS